MAKIWLMLDDPRFCVGILLVMGFAAALCGLWQHHDFY
jgi:hypothetical protein